MKKLFITFILCMTIMFASAQTTFVEIGVNPPSISTEDVNWTTKVGTNIGQKYGVAAFYERYNTENYISYGIQPSLGGTIVGGLQYGIGTEISMIERYTSFGDESYLTYAVNGELSYQIDNLAVFYGYDLKRRPDLGSEKYSLSSGVGLRVFLF